jgi:predicted DCC family thiol-disulfide oxidoreductase YuxK
MRPDRATLIYDGECGFCRQAVDLVRRWDREHRIALVPFQDQARVAGFGIPLPALAAAMHLVLAPQDGRVFAGADAAPQILKLLPGRRWLAWPFRVPGVLPAARGLYGWIARRRRCLVRGYAGR